MAEIITALEWSYAFIAVFVAAVVGMSMAIVHFRERRRVVMGTDRGYIYFLTRQGGEFDDPPAPIKIGMTHRDPENDRLPEIETMSPYPLQVLFSYSTQNPKLAEKLVHKQLAPYRMHGEWFEREPTLAFIDHLQEVMKQEGAA